MNDLLPILGISLGLTLLIEGAFSYITGICSGKDLLLVFLVNILTNPAAVLCYYFFTVYTQLNVFITKIPIELVVILIEGLYYRKYASTIHKPFLFSAFANALSFGTGLILNAIF